MRHQFASLGISDRYKRFDATLGAEAPQRAETSMPAGHLGCWLSHQALWTQGLASAQHLHILEDDAVLSPLLFATLKAVDLPDSNWDLLFTDLYFHPPPTPEQFVRLRQWTRAYAENRKVTLTNLKDWSFTGTTSYLINRHSIAKLIALTDGQWKLNQTFDIHLRNLVRNGQIRAFVTIPFLTTLSSGNVASTTGGQGPAFAEINAFREAFFYKADPLAIYTKVKSCESTHDTEPMLGIYLELLRQVIGTIRLS